MQNFINKDKRKEQKNSKLIDKDKQNQKKLKTKKKEAKFH